MVPFPEIRTGLGYDVHKFEKGRPLWLCGVKIEYDKGLIGHSDADVGLHALCDSLLGASALRDIGYHFPDTDLSYKGADSKLLLEHVDKLVKAHGYELANADITIVAQVPKLAPYIETMRETVAKVLKVRLNIISIKATTTEHLGFTGREEGIAAYAIATLYRLNNNYENR